jgi:ACS family pantothenate transporter-like MFS transporter
VKTRLTAIQNFLLIGGSVSSTDIARELGPIAQNIYQSHRNGAFDLSANLLPENAVRVDEVVSFEIPTNAETSSQIATTDPIPATVVLKSGRKLCDIHHVILCTGYHLTLPFLSHLHSDDTPVDQADDTVLVTDGTQFHNLHKDIFYIKDPSLAFVGVPFFTATFTLFEFQAMVVAKVLSGLAQLPNELVMRAEYDARVRAKGYGKAFHSLRDKEEEYVNELLEWVNRDSERKGKNIIPGYSEQWREAREAQVQRVKALYAKQVNLRQLEVSCYN